jgi:hypothetical protein
MFKAQDNLRSQALCKGAKKQTRQERDSMSAGAGGSGFKGGSWQIAYYVLLNSQPQLLCRLISPASLSAVPLRFGSLPLR